MKTILITLLLSLVHLFISAQGILAGDTTASNIIYVDIDNFTVSTYYPEGYESVGLDVDMNGTDDFSFISSKSSSMGTAFEETRCNALGVLPEIVNYVPNPFWVASVGFMEMIGPENDWDDGGLLKGTYSMPDTTTYAGVVGSGYIGFKLLINQQICYGWIRVFASSGSVTVFEYAYQSPATNMAERLYDLKVKVFPDPVRNDLFIDFGNNQHKEDLSFLIMNLQGEVVKQGNTQLSDPLIDCSELSTGCYVLRLKGNNTRFVPLKFVKL